MTDTLKPPAPKTTGGLVGGIIRTARPKQWVKNVLVLAAPFTAEKLAVPSVLIAAALAFVAFSLVASSVYLINDARDVDADRAHPTKCNRPIAAGIVPIPVAYGAAGAFVAGGMAVAAFTSWKLLLVLGVYWVIQVGYCLGWKHQPVIDLCIVASGFLIRAIAGGAASGITLSQWFLLVTGFGSLFMVAGKRYAEVILFERTGAQIRESLKKYSASYLRFIWAISAAIMIMSYAQWAWDARQISHNNPLLMVLSLVPFVVAVLRYAVDVDSGNAGEPDVIALNDRVLQVLGLAWVVLLGGAIYLNI